ncbi:hypothetical protein CPB83DRAFT_836689 [Crepidotus variabilis]|uniref:C2H2-type domain-containing protein n=1 Tax=Crepidotus variabilis TaxID=179855 RepID=A0A9P6EE55_9AGAR|nr:hypothetical protein CPB83DRAFT_836689 [Crepidotus variabilis]
MDNRDPRQYSYETQQAYPSGHVAAHNVDYVAIDGYTYDGPTQYYTPPNPSLSSGSDESNPASPYFRNTTTSMVSPHRYQNTNREVRYPSPANYVGNPSPSQTVYSSTQTPPYPSQYLPMPDQNVPQSLHHPPQQTRFIPTPSQIANSYSNYAQQVVDPSGHHDLYGSSSLDYSSNSHLIPSSAGRPARISTARPRGSSSNSNSNSPVSATSSPSGERFPCEKCGKTFSRSHDRKRHYETQHLPSPVIHRCGYCHKEFSRADSLKRHLDNGCDEMRS